MAVINLYASCQIKSSGNFEDSFFIKVRQIRMIKKDHSYILATAILWGTITVGGHFFSNRGLSLYEIAIFRCFFIAILSLGVLVATRRKIFHRKLLPFFIVYGIIGALLDLSVFGSVVLGTPIAIVAFLLGSQPIWTVIFDRLFFKQGITRAKILAMSVALSGMFVLVRGWEISALGNPVGILFALLGSVLVALWIIWSKKASHGHQDYLSIVFGWSVFQLLWLLLLFPPAEFLIKDPSITHLSWTAFTNNGVYFLIFAFVSGIAPSFFLNKGLKNLQASTSGVILLMEPVSAAILAAIFFGQHLDFAIVVGGTLIIMANVEFRDLKQLCSQLTSRSLNLSKVPK